MKKDSKRIVHMKMVSLIERNFELGQVLYEKILAGVYLKLRFEVDDLFSAPSVRATNLFAIENHGRV